VDACQPVRRLRINEHHFGDRDPLQRVRWIVNFQALERWLPVAAWPEGADAVAPVGGSAVMSSGGVSRRRIHGQRSAVARTVPIEQVRTATVFHRLRRGRAGTPGRGSTPGACHHCLLVPETSCEAFNHSLDRSVLNGHGTARGFLGY